MTKEFNILEHNKRKILETLLMDKCKNFINLFCDEIKEYNFEIRKTLVEELYKGSTISNQDNKIVITLGFLKDEN